MASGKSYRRGKLDRWAIGLSGLCMAHCLATALFLGAASAVGGLLHSPFIHEVGLVLAIVLGGIALGRGIQAHGQRLPLAVGVVGLAIMAGALTMPHGNGEVGVTLIGVTLLGLGHYLNRRAVA